MGFDGYIRFWNPQGGRAVQIVGDSTSLDHKNWIEIQSFNHEIAQATGGSASAQGSLAGGRADHGDVTFEKLLDIASTRMAIACCAGQSYQMAEIHLCRDTGKKEVFAVYRLGNCIISKIAAAGSGSDATPKETVNVRYREIHWVYRWLNDNGAVIKDDATGWSASKNQELTAGKGYSKDDSASELIPAWSGS